MKLTAIRTPHQIAHRVIVSGRPFATRFARGFRWGRLKLELNASASEVNMYAGKGEWDASCYFHTFDGGLALSVKDMIRRALPYGPPDTEPSDSTEDWKAYMELCRM